MAKKYTSVMFDLDGTLLDTIDDIQNAINITMREYGFPEHSRDEVRSFINDGAFMLIKRAIPESEREDENAKKILLRYLEIYDEHVNEKTHPYEGCKELVARLKKEGFRLAVVSNKPDRHVRLLSEFFFGKDTFEYVSGSGLGMPSKPDRECVDRAVRQMKIDIRDMLYVGDSHVDSETAHNAGVPCAGVTWGFHGRNGFLDSIPDFYIDNADQLYNLICGK